jgi:hypothetical protein
VGIHGYSRRLQNRIYSTMIDGTVHFGMAALLHQDTRYLRSPNGGAGYRTPFLEEVAG